jgi:hypothetical protein
VLTVSCGLTCSLPPVGTSPTGGVLANTSGGPGGGSSSIVALEAVNPALTFEESLDQLLIEIAPPTATEDPGLLRRAPTCR